MTFAYRILPLVVMISMIPEVSSATIHQLKPSIEVDGRGVYLDQLCATGSADNRVPNLRISDAPKFGESLNLSVSEIESILEKTAPGLAGMEWQGVESITITRKVRTVTQAELVERLQSIFQGDEIGDTGEIKLKFLRKWPEQTIPDDAMEVRIDEFPVNGFRSRFILNFSIWNDEGQLYAGDYPVNVQILKKVWVAASKISRGSCLADADRVLETRDILSLRGKPWSGEGNPSDLEIKSSVMKGYPILERVLRPKPVVFRGDMVDGILQSGLLQIKLRLEVLEDGAPGQLIRLRNIQNKRQIRGKVYDGNTIQLSI